MTISTTRRSVALGLPFLLGMSIAAPLFAAESPIADIERRYGIRLGVHHSGVQCRLSIPVQAGHLLIEPTSAF
jgi:hypothetical protein